MFMNINQITCIIIEVISVITCISQPQMFTVVALFVLQLNEVNTYDGIKFASNS